MTFWLIIILTLACFALGFVLSWIRVKRRINARLDAVLSREIQRRAEAEILRRITEGPLRDEAGPRTNPSPDTERE